MLKAQRRGGNRWLHPHLDDALSSDDVGEDGKQRLAHATAVDLEGLPVPQVHHGVEGSLQDTQ